MKTVFKQTLTVFRLILNYITNSYIQVRQSEDGHFWILVNTPAESTEWIAKPEYLLVNIEKAKELWKIERVVYV